MDFSRKLLSKSDKNNSRSPTKLEQEQEEIIDLVYVKDEDLKELEELNEGRYSGMESQESNSEELREQLKRKDAKNLGETTKDSRKREIEDRSFLQS